MSKEKFNNAVSVANNYYLATNVLKEKMEGEKGEDSFENHYMELIFPLLTMGGLTCEIYIKALRIRNEKERKDCHNLQTLFSEISDIDQERCKRAFLEKCSIDLQDALSSIKKVFVDWRYLYEREEKDKDKKGIKPEYILCFMNILYELCNEYKKDK